ncbi:MAG: hypothetical protein HOH50_04695 [Planctomycetaceae bacterium]|nr:hypothetical protein [Planctomycetaceae bacterium]MBT5883510.1 hypothetical protein [Planctomycetaceae bacterium]
MVSISTDDLFSVWAETNAGDTIWTSLDSQQLATRQGIPYFYAVVATGTDNPASVRTEMGTLDSGGMSAECLQ